MDTQLTLKQRKFIRLYLACGNATEAAHRAYDCKNRESAAQIGYENLRKLDFLFRNLLQKYGVTDKKLINVLNAGLDATKVISANIVITKSDDPTVKEQKAHSKTQDFIDVPDFATRKEYLKIALQLMRFLEEKEKESAKFVNVFMGNNGSLTDRDKKREEHLLGRLDRYFGNGKE